MLPKAKGPVIVMTLVVGVSISAVIYSHYSQVRDRNVMKEGVERDKERLRSQRQRLQQQQQQ